MNLLKTKTPAFNLVSLTIGIVYFVFGILKFFPHLSPAEDLAEQTISKLTFGIISGKLAIYSLAFLETIIGLAFMLQIKYQFVIKIALFHMVCTFLPFIFFPEYTFNSSLSSFSITGQYIVKNIIIISALLNLKTTINTQQQISFQ